jgi:hypothetical protein
MCTGTVEGDREQRGEPTNCAGKVDTIEHLLTAVTFQVYDYPFVAGPFT